ncbi:hypothetical protein SAMN03159363_4353 [Variovorax sp. EL159]|nr:hypothetical protein SAMN03159363_4353 [Variovorax sp. EL159]
MFIRNMARSNRHAARPIVRVFARLVQGLKRLRLVFRHDGGKGKAGVTQSAQMVFANVEQLRTIAFCARGVARLVERKSPVCCVEPLHRGILDAIGVVKIQACGAGRRTKPCKLSAGLRELFLEQLDEGIPAVLGRLSCLARHHGAGRDRGRSPQAAEQAHQERPERLQDSAQPAGPEFDRSELASFTLDCRGPWAIEIDAGGCGRDGSLLRRCIESQRVFQRWARRCCNRWRRCRGGSCRWIGDAHGGLLVVVEESRRNTRLREGKKLIDDRRGIHGRRLPLAAGLCWAGCRDCSSRACAARTSSTCNCAKAHVAAIANTQTTKVVTAGVRTAQYRALRRRWRAFCRSVVVCPWVNAICACSACSCTLRSVTIRAVDWSSNEPSVLAFAAS